MEINLYQPPTLGGKTLEQWEKEVEELNRLIAEYERIFGHFVHQVIDAQEDEAHRRGLVYEPRRRDQGTSRVAMMSEYKHIGSDPSTAAWEQAVRDSNRRRALKIQEELRKKKEKENGQEES